MIYGSRNFALTLPERAVARRSRAALLMLRQFTVRLGLAISQQTNRFESN